MIMAKTAEYISLFRLYIKNISIVSLLFCIAGMTSLLAGALWSLWGVFKVVPNDPEALWEIYLPAIDGLFYGYLVTLGGALIIDLVIKWAQKT